MELRVSDAHWLVGGIAVGIWITLVIYVLIRLGDEPKK